MSGGPMKRIRSWNEFVLVVLRHKKKALFTFLFIAGASTAFALLRPDVYRSEAKLLVRPGRENLVVDPLAEPGNVLGLSRSWENEINSELEILTSRSVAEKVIGRLGPEFFLYDASEPEDPGSQEGKSNSEGGIISQLRAGARSLLESLGLSRRLPPAQKALLIFSKNLRVHALRKSNVIAASFEAHSPESARRVLDTLVSVYQEERKIIYRPRESYDFFKRQTELLQEELARTQQRLRDLKNRYGVASIEDWRRILTERMGELERRIQETSSKLAASEAKVRALEEFLKKLPETVQTSRSESSPSYGSDLMRQRLFDLKVKELDLIARYGEGTTPVQVVREQVQEAQRFLKQQSVPRKEVTVGLNSTRQEVEKLLFAGKAEFAALQVELEALKTYLGGMRSDVESLNETEMQLANVRRELRIQEANYQRYAENREQARIDRAIAAEKLSSVSVVQPATLPIKPVGRWRLLNLLLGFAAAVLGAVSVALTAEYLTSAISRPEDVEEALQAPTLAVIPRLRSRTLRPQALIGDVAVSGRARGGSLAFRSRRAWDTTERSREYFEALQARLGLSLDGDSPPVGVIGVTSCHPGEGASTVAANFAARLSRGESGRVLLLHVPGKGQVRRVEQLFRLDLPTASEEDEPKEGKGVVIRPVALGGSLDVVHSLPRDCAPVTLRRIVEQLRARYSFVVIDLPPVTTDSASLKWAPLTDGMVLVVEADRVSFELAERTKRILEGARTRLLGVVLNKSRGGAIA